jgi:hypothetical protein
MLDTGNHQAMTLQHAAPQADLRVIGVVHHGTPETDQAGMWELCSALHRHGYPVAVLDGTVAETEANPGLADLLQDALWDDGSSPDAQSMSIIPAGRGLRMLARATHTGTPLHRLQGLFRMYRAVIVYAGAAAMAPLFEDGNSEPVLFVPPEPGAVVSAYNSFKQLKVQSGVSARIVAVVPEDGDAAMEQHAERVQASVRQCAITHMGCAPRASSLRLDSPHDAQRLALQLLENAIKIGGAPSSLLQSAAGFGMNFHEVRSH